MPRQETIKVTIDKQSAEQSLQALQNKADALKKSLANVKVADAKSSSQQLANEAKNTQALAKAEKELENATKARLAAQKEAIAVATAQINAEKAAQNAKKAASQAAQAQIKTQTQALKLTQQIEKAAEREAKVMRSLGEAMGTINSNQATSIASMTQYIRSQEGMENATVRATGAIHNSAGSFQTYSASVRTADGALQTYRYSVNTTTGDVYKLDKGVKSLSTSLGTAGKAALSFVKQIVGFYGAAQSIRYALKEMKSMSDEMIVYQKVTKATDLQMEQIRKQSYATAKAYGQTPTDFLSAAQEMARAGYGEQASAMADLAVKTKLVGDITAEEASKFLLAVDAGYKYGGSIEQLSHVLDMANEVGNNYATSIGKISEGMTLVASLAGQANIPIEQLIAALGTMTAATQRSGSEMARALRFITLGILGDTVTEVEEGVTVTAEEVDSLTTALQHYAPEVVEAAKASGQLINPMEAIASLAKAYKSGLIGSQEELFSISKAIAGQRYYNAFAALIENYDTLYLGMLEHEKNAAGSADAEIDRLTKSWSTKFNRLKTQWVEMVNASLSEGLIKDLIEGSTAALEFAGSLENLAGAALGAYAAFKSLKAGLAGMKEAGGSISGFGAGNWFGIGAGVLIAGISAAKSAYEKSMRDAQSAAEKAVSSAIEKTSGAKDMASILARYKKIASDGIDKEKGELGELKTLQNDLNNLVGDQGKAIDIVNGKYGDTLKKLKEMTEEQRQAALMTLQTAKSQAVANWKQQDLNGTFVSGLNTGVPMEYNKAIEGYLKNSKYFRVFEGADGFPMLFMNKKPEDAEGILEFYKEIEDFYNWLGSHTSTGEEAAKGMKSMGEEYSSMYVKLASFVSLVKTAAGPVKEAQDAIDNFNKAMSEDGSTSSTGSGNAGDNNKKVEKSYMTLADAIEEATKAKEKFDDAMKKTKADEANAYTKAFKTYKDEVKKGRVNSTAFYAAARMLLGDDAYNRTNGSSSAVRAALNKRKAGTSGSIMDAWNILSASYKNKKGVEMEGYGIYQLLSQTKGVKGLSSKTLVDKNGNIRIPKLSDQQWNQISKQWGGISKAALLNYFNSFDQYNKKGKATDDKTKTKKQLTDEQKNTKAVNDASKAIKSATDAVNNLAGKLGEDKNPGDGEGDKGGEGAGETPPPTEPPAEETPKDTTTGGDLSEKQSAVDKLNESIDTLMQKISSLNGTSLAITLNPEASSAFANISRVIDGLTGTEGYVFNFKTGESFEVESGKVVSLQTALASIDTLVENGIITPEFGTQLKVDLTAAVNALKQENFAGPTVTVDADTTPAETTIQTFQDGDYNTNVVVDAYTATAKKKIEEMANPEGGYEAKVTAVAETQGAATAISGVLSDLNTLEEMKKGGKISEDIYIQAKGNANRTLSNIISKTTSLDELDKITLDLLANDNVTGDVQKILEAKYNDLVLNVTDNPQTFREHIQALQDAEYKTSVIVDANTQTAQKKFASLLAGEEGKGYLVQINAAVHGTGETSIKSMADSLKWIKEQEKNGNIPVTVASEWTGKLTDKLSEAISSCTTLDELGEVAVDLYGNDLVTPEVEAILAEQYDIIVGVDANTDSYDTELEALEDAGGETEVDVGVSDGSTTAFKQWVNGLPKSKTILPVIKDSAAKTAIGKLTKTEYKDVWVTIKTTGEGGGNTGRAGNGTGGGNAGSGTGGGTPGGAGGVSSGSGSGAAGWDKPRFTKGYATGTNSFSGGAALVNDGAGPELIVNRGRAFIAGGGKPTVVNLDKGAKIFTATETRNILNNGGMPSFAGGTGEYSADVKPGDYKADSGKKKKSSSKSKKNSKDKGNDYFSKLQDMVDYIINRIGTAVSEQIKVIDGQIAQLQKERELQKQQNELAEKQKAVADAQKDLQDAMKERTVRYLGEDGKWHWQADARKVKSAQENLDKAKKDLKEYKEEQAFNKKVERLENKKTNLQNNYDTLSKQWSDIVAGVNTPTGTINKLLNDVMKNGTKQEKEGAKAIQNVLLKNAKSGKFSGNYSEALRAIAAATAGNPVMPGDTSTTLASLIAGAGGEKISSSLRSVLSTATAKSKKSKTGTFKTIGGTTQNTITNYYVNGAKIGADTAKNKSLSAVLDELKVYAGG